MKRLATIILSLLASLTTTAMAQNEMEIRSQGTKPYTIEVKPLTGLLSLVPGVGAITLGTEAFFLPKVAAFGEVSYLDMSLPNRIVDKAKKDNTGPIPKKMIGTGALLGARYYTSPERHSWYAGAGVGYADSKGRWDYKDNIIESRVVTVLPAVQAGYRWFWPNNLLLRVGAAVSSNQVQSRYEKPKEATATANEGARKVKDLTDQVVVANVDLGLGYAF